MRQQQINNALLIGTTLMLAACAEEFTAYVSVSNDENAGGHYITSINVVQDCTEGWGGVNDKYSIPPNTRSDPIAVEYDGDRIIHPAQDREDTTVDVRACFTSGTCGDQKDISVNDGDISYTAVRDEGKPTYQYVCG